MLHAYRQGELADWITKFVTCKGKSIYRTDTLLPRRVSLLHSE